jgi:hypothetical protein
MFNHVIFSGVLTDLFLLRSPATKANVPLSLRLLLVLEKKYIYIFFFSVIWRSEMRANKDDVSEVWLVYARTNMMCVSAIDDVYSSTVFGTELETDSHCITVNNTFQI